MNPLKRFGAAYSSFMQGGEGFETPDVPRAQQLALGQAIVAVLVVFGFDPDSGTQELILAVAAAIGVALPVSDAVIRKGRAEAASGLQEAKEAARDAARQASDAPSLEDRRDLIVLRDRLARTRLR